MFLHIARSILHEQGFHQLSMDLVAEKAEYSKGTIYQHFSCKEEMLIQLCNRTMAGLYQLGQRAITYNGTHRERLLAFQVAHELWIELVPGDICMLQNLHKAHADQSGPMLRELQHTAVRNENMFNVLMEACKYCSLGQLTDAMFEVVERQWMTARQSRRR